VRTRGQTLPCRATCCSDHLAGHLPPPSKSSTPPKSHGLLEGFCAEPHPEEQIALNSNNRLLLLRLADIDWLESSDNGVALHIGKEIHLLDNSFAAVTTKLPRARFLRISTSALVNFGRIKCLRPMCQGEWRVLLRNGTRLILTRGYGEHLRQAGWFLSPSVRPLVRSRIPAGRSPGK